MPLLDKVVLIAGGASPVGRKLAGAFARARAHIAVCVRRPADVAALQRQTDPGPSLTVHGDVCYEEDVIRMVHRVTHHFGRIDVLINAASILGPRARVMDYSVDPWRDVLETNVTGAFLLCREVLPWMNRQNAGCIINVMAGFGRQTRGESAAYFVSAQGVEGLTRTLAAELKGTGVRANTVEVAHSAFTGKDRDGENENWLETFLWLASEEASSVTGQSFRAFDFARPPVRDPAPDA